MLKLVTVEAQAYLRLGLMSPSRRRVLQSPKGQADTGVLFVPGVGANGSQFLGLKRALEPYAQWFGSFEYSSLRHPRALAEDLAEYVEKVAPRSDRLVVVGHSLGGLLLRMVLQDDDVPDNVLGWVSICAPLHGTWRSRLALSPGLRALAPDSDMMRDVLAGAHRLERLEGRILTIGARYDQMIAPHTSAFLDPHPQLELDHVAHAGSLLDRRVFGAVTDAVRRWQVS
ncbi:MAG: alpha/beta fold hydrolase [Myxococcales bacterium]|nr:alpha/beta fold hydrolase [Myxococcales bacterium]MCB9647348.1 alpha/beta fold hydrolase [Deltaproteobacteria bacterium]